MHHVDAHRMTGPLADLSAALADGRVWVALAVACVAMVVVLPLGVVISSRTGLLDSEAEPSEVVSVGLSVGLLVFAAVWASIASFGLSGLVPVAITILVAVVIGSGPSTLRGVASGRWWAGAAGAGAAFLVVVGLLYAITLAPSPRDGYQPLEFFDTAYYAVLGADLASFGRESLFSPAGFEQVAGQTDQVWYHWGELWLAAAAIDLTGVTPMHARHLVVLPLILLAAATLVGTLARRLVARSSEFYILGATAMLFLAPIPLSLDVYFAGRARGLVFTITQYGLVVTVILLGIYLLAVRRTITASWAGALMAGAIAAALVATHVGLAIVVAAALTGAVAVHALQVALSRGGQLGHVVEPLRRWQRTGLAVIAAGSATIVWGIATGHGLGALDPVVGVGPFDPIWQQAVVFTTLGSGVLLAAPLAWLWIRRRDSVMAGLGLAAAAVVAAGAVGWGLRAADVNTFHLFFGAIATVLTPVSIVAILMAVDRGRRRGIKMLVPAVVSLLIVQSLVSAVLVFNQLERFGPKEGWTISAGALEAFGELPPGSKMAYACEPYENVAPWDASLIAIDAHTGVRMIPMCYMADVQRDLLERPLELGIVNPYFKRAPQRALYPSADIRLSIDEVRSFLVANGIGYVYADADHPNTLNPDAVPIFTDDATSIYSVR
jgi:hypothetical protein